MYILYIVYALCILRVCVKRGGKNGSGCAHGHAHVTWPPRVAGALPDDSAASCESALCPDLQPGPLGSQRQRLSQARHSSLLSPTEPENSTVAVTTPASPPRPPSLSLGPLRRGSDRSLGSCDSLKPLESREDFDSGTAGSFQSKRHQE